MLLFIDNYDSFTYNIVQYFAELGQNVEVRRNDDITLEAIAALKPRYLVIGPGPCTPKEAGISIAAIRHFAGKLPVMGVCLGHQAIGEAFGGDTVTCTRYHSLVIDRATLPECLEITSWTEDNEIMGVRHKNYAVEGVQFHPEALLTEYGHDMLRNFLEEFKDFKAA